MGDKKNRRTLTLLDLLLSFRTAMPFTSTARAHKASEPKRHTSVDCAAWWADGEHDGYASDEFLVDCEPQPF